MSFNCDCEICANYWTYEEAFDKFGSPSVTAKVQKVLTNAGYSVGTSAFLLHNTIIDSIKRAGSELIPDGITHGYDDPHDYLPMEIIQLLEEADYV